MDRTEIPATDVQVVIQAKQLNKLLFYKNQKTLILLTRS